MNLDDFINDAENTQVMSNAFEAKKKDDENKKAEKRRSQWDRVRAVMPKLQNDFAMFDGVELNRIYEFRVPYQWEKGYRAFTCRKDFKIGQPECDSYVRPPKYLFDSTDGHFCANINMLNTGYYGDRDGIKVQVALNPKTDKIQYYFTTSYMVFNEARQYLDLPEDKGYEKKIFESKTKVFTTYKALKEYITDFLKQTVNVDDLKKKNYEQKILELKPKRA